MIADFLETTQAKTKWNAILKELKKIKQNSCITKILFKTESKIKMTGMISDHFLPEDLHYNKRSRKLLCLEGK